MKDKRGSKREKLLIVLLLFVVLIGVGAYTYARYTSSLSASGTTSIAAWSVNLTDGASETSTLTFDITDDNDGNVADGKLAPGGIATATIYLDASGSEVSLDYTVTIGDLSVTNENITVTGVTANGTALSETSTGVYSGRILLANVDTEVKLEITVEWTDENTTTANETDTNTTSTSGVDLELPVTIVATQYTGE